MCYPELKSIQLNVKSGERRVRDEHRLMPLFGGDASWRPTLVHTQLGPTEALDALPPRGSRTSAGSSARPRRSSPIAAGQSVRTHVRRVCRWCLSVTVFLIARFVAAGRQIVWKQPVHRAQRRDVLSLPQPRLSKNWGMSRTYGQSKC